MVLLPLSLARAQFSPIFPFLTPATQASLTLSPQEEDKVTPKVVKKYVLRAPSTLGPYLEGSNPP